ncbi:MAG: HAD family phosphatase [Butyribacter sp.]|nr:HAD family phosphatase [bacterium]MDY3855371.1 HAD family phosphatase [Butyribacter sp.]
MITGAIFDMDGVLLDSMPLWEEAGIWYLEANGKVPEPGLKEILFTKTMTDAAEYIRVTYSLEKTVDEILKEMIEMIRCRYETDIPAKEGALSFMRQLREKKIPVTIATSSDRVLAQAGLTRLGFLPYIDAIFTCNELGVGKDRPDIFIEAQKSMGTKRETTWIFEDSLHAIRSAKKAGFPVVGLYDVCSRQNQDSIRKETDIYMDNLKDFDAFYSRA